MAPSTPKIPLGTPSGKRGILPGTADLIVEICGKGWVGAACGAPRRVTVLHDQAQVSLHDLQ